MLIWATHVITDQVIKIVYTTVPIKCNFISDENTCD